MGFEHRVRKADIPVCPILGVKIAAIDMQWLLDFTKKYLHVLSGDYMCVSNVHTIITAYENKKYRDVQNGGIMAIPDGGPLSSVGRKRGYSNMKRTTGPDYMEEILKMSVENNYRHFFLGSTQENLEKMRKLLLTRCPGLQIGGMYSPPFRVLSEEEDNEIIEKINASDSDFIWVGLGAPKQEIWMAEHQGKIKGFMVGVGAAFDYYTGNIRRAPQWMQKINLEWLCRLTQDPKRLIKRYFHTNLMFIYHVYLRGK